MSLNEVRQRAKEIGVNNILTEEYDDFHSIVPWDNTAPQKALVPERYTVENRVADNAEVQPMNGFNSGNFLNSAQVDYKLDASDVSVIDHAFLCVNITNSTGAAVTLPPTPFWFDKIEVLAPNSNTLCTLYDIELWQSICMLPRVDFDSLATLMGTTTAYSTAGVTIANNGSTELYLPLITLFNACRLHLPGINASLTFPFYAKPSAMTLIAGSHPTITKAVMLLCGFDESQDKRNARTAVYRNRVPRFSRTPLYLPFYNWERFTQTLTLNPSVKSDIKLSGFSGMFSSLFIVIRAKPLSAANQGTYIALDSFSVADESGAIFDGNHIKTHARSRIIIAGQMHNLSAANVNYYMVPFSSDVVGDFISGQVHGYQVFKGNEVLSITPGAGLTAGSYDVDVLALRGNALRIMDGNVEKRQ